ncbi:HD-GYP domain-containing protein [Halanaerobacter jeridensis]|uniref:Nucleotidyltransferase with HDIG domain n=1 Tax=Halanaerobacter jeridensis TaxID=706427 RepID=A0A938XWP9_9FIRM|nr:HD-GYP domain-containing protein [Halanaerobacter jeridensis]MBM7557651.1 putative nucleotidyltransferase with HDIG domain [Halanaerobacter jeridensis]
MKNISANKKIDVHDVIEILITTLSTKDRYTFEHSWRVAELATAIAQEMKLDHQEIERIHYAAHLHDIGKIGVEEKVLNKSGKLTATEMKKMQEHPGIGHEILWEIPLFTSVSTIVLYHHERYDGLGYPSGLEGKQIPLGSRIIAVADTFDAITSDRSYRLAKSYGYAYNEVNEHSGEQFCPRVVKHFNKIFTKIPDLLKEVEKKIENDFVAEDKIKEINHNSLFHSKKV